MHVHILGICGTFMGGIAATATQLGHKVTGSDHNVYPPMSTQLEKLGIELTDALDMAQFDIQPDIVVIGNALSRGHPAVEYVLDRNLDYTSGPQWLLDNLLKDRWVLAVSGTHGKTSTASMLAWILEEAKLNPGFLIGGVPENFGISARVGDSPFFVIEADEYDSAFFDKRSKFVHYRPKTLILNNLEFDHADIFDDLSDIQKQFHHVIRTVPSNGLLIAPSIKDLVPVNSSISIDKNVAEVLVKGVWSDLQSVGTSTSSIWKTSKLTPDASSFMLTLPSNKKNSSSSDISTHNIRVDWSLIGEHNMNNAAMAIAAARHAGVLVEDAVKALASFENVKRRMEVKGVVNGVTVYDDFAHHPTAIKTTIDGLRKKVGDKKKIIAVIELRTNTMRKGILKDTLASSWQQASEVVVLNKDIAFSLDTVISESEIAVVAKNTVDEIVTYISKVAEAGDSILVMSNGSFSGIHGKILDKLSEL